MYQWQKKQRRENSEFQNDVCVLVYQIKSIWEVLLPWSFFFYCVSHITTVPPYNAVLPVGPLHLSSRNVLKQPCVRRIKLRTHKWQQRCQGWTINRHQEQFSIEMGLSESKQRVSHLTRPALCRISVRGLVWHWKMAFAENRQRTAETKNDSKCHCPQLWGGLLHSACQVQVVERQGWKGKVKVT